MVSVNVLRCCYVYSIFIRHQKRQKTASHFPSILLTENRNSAFFVFSTRLGTHLRYNRSPFDRLSVANGRYNIHLPLPFHLFTHCQSTHYSGDFLASYRGKCTTKRRFVTCRRCTFIPPAMPPLGSYRHQ